jgi:hypothetical protein
MDMQTKVWLAVEVAVAFFLPLTLGWIFLLMLVPIQLEAIQERPEQWGGPAFVFCYLIAAPIGMTAMYVMLVYLLGNGRRILPSRVIIVCVAVGLVSLALISIPASDFSAIGMLYLLPLICACHVLYLGRSYFSANKPSEPTR